MKVLIKFPVFKKIFLYIFWIYFIQKFNEITFLDTKTLLVNFIFKFIVNLERKVEEALYKDVI